MEEYYAVCKGCGLLFFEVETHKINEFGYHKIHDTRTDLEMEEGKMQRVEYWRGPTSTEEADIRYYGLEDAFKKKERVKKTKLTATRKIEV